MSIHTGGFPEETNILRPHDNSWGIMHPVGGMVKRDYSNLLYVTLGIVFTASPQWAQPVPAVTPPAPAILQNYQTVTAERLQRPADGDWLMVRRTYDGWGYSPL